MTGSLALIGAGALATGLTGLLLPAGQRLSAGLALIAGAGAGVVSLAVGLMAFQGANTAAGTAQRVFLVASAIGFVAVLASLGVLWRRARRDDGAED